MESNKENIDRKNLNWKKILSTLLTVGFVAYGIIRLILCFQIIEFKSFIEPKGKKILMFTLEPSVYKIIDGRIIRGSVIGIYVLKTEYGEITLRTFCDVEAGAHSLHVIKNHSFKNGRASHNLVVYGIKMPKDINIVYDFRMLKIQRLALDFQEITVSGIPLCVDGFYFMNSENPAADIKMIINYAPEYITLSDSTQINVDSSRPFLGTLLIYDKAERWVLANTSVQVKLPDETEFRKYKSITFKKDWGEFIEGELFEEGTQ